MPPAAFTDFAGAASRLRAGALRRASAQAGRPLAGLTYALVRSARPSGFGLAGPAFLNIPVLFTYGFRLSTYGSTGKRVQLFNSPLIDEKGPGLCDSVQSGTITDREPFFCSFLHE